MHNNSNSKHLPHMLNKKRLTADKDQQNSTPRPTSNLIQNLIQHNRATVCSAANLQPPLALALTLTLRTRAPHPANSEQNSRAGFGAPTVREREKDDLDAKMDLNLHQQKRRSRLRPPSLSRHAPRGSRLSHRRLSMDVSLVAGDATPVSSWPTLPGFRSGRQHHSPPERRLHLAESPLRLESGVYRADLATRIPERWTLLVAPIPSCLAVRRRGPFHPSAGTA